MAKMIPPQYDESTRSSAEKRIFDLLKNDPDTDSWIVLHSLGLSRRSKKPYGEIDFVLIVPGGGIICLEVKGGRVSCKDGIWVVADRHGRTHSMKRSPFMQAREGMFALRDALKNSFGDNHSVMRCPLGYAVVFSDVDSPPVTTEFESWEVIDRTDLQKPISRSIRRLIRDQRRRLGHQYDPTLITPEVAREVRQLLRPNFEIIVARSAQIGKAEAKLLQLTRRQYDVLDRLHENPRCMIKGAAGTGKTLLSIEYAKRAARDGKRVLLVCYNRILGDWLSEQMQTHNNVTAGSYYRLLREIIITSSLANEFRQHEKSSRGPELFDDIFPFYGELAATETDPFDMLVLDEAQDLLRPSVLSVLNTYLRGGLAGGHWVISGDFTNQAIYYSGEVGTTDLIDKYCPYYTRERLTANCRNTRQIAEETVLLSGFPTPPFRFSPVEGLAVDYRYWRNQRHQVQVLSRVIDGYLQEGVTPEDIVVLSPVSFGRSVASQEKLTEAYRLEEISNQSQPLTEEISKITFSTIHAFKGMESPIIIICDVDTIEAERPQSLLYTGMSRARSHLSVLLHESTRHSLRQLMTRKLTENWDT